MYRWMFMLGLLCCNTSFANSCYQLVQRQAYQTAVTVCEYQANGGDAAAQSNLGFMYQHGRGVSQDFKRAFYWYQQAASSGRSSAQSSLAFLYQQGLGTELNLDQAIYWYQQAAAGGRSAAQYNLAQLFRLRPENQFADARYWFERAAIQGHAKAQLWLAYFYQHGLGGKQDNVKAAIWYEMSAKQNRTASFVRLGFKYQTSAQSDAKDQALQWYQKAAELGSEVAKLNIASLNR